MKTRGFLKDEAFYLQHYRGRIGLHEADLVFVQQQAVYKLPQ